MIADHEADAMRVNGVTRAQVVALRDEADRAGDLVQVEICRRAFEGDADDWRDCAETIRNAMAQNDESAVPS